MKYIILLCLLFAGCACFEIPNGFKLKSSKYISPGVYELKCIEDDTGQEVILYTRKPRTGEGRSTLAPPTEGYHQSWN